MSEDSNQDEKIVKKCMEYSEAQIAGLLERQKKEMVADLTSYDVKISTVEKQAKEIEADKNIDFRTKAMLLQGLREYWAIKKKKMMSETKGSTRK